MRTLGRAGTIGAAAALALVPLRAEGAAQPKTATATKLFLDVHDFGPGKVTAQAVAAAHKKDLATQAKYGVRYQSYWFDEKAGKVYCLAEAPSAEAAISVHREAHGLLADRIAEVSADSARWTPRSDKKLFLDVHHLELARSRRPTWRARTRRIWWPKASTTRATSTTGSTRRMAP